MNPLAPVGQDLSFSTQIVENTPAALFQFCDLIQNTSFETPQSGKFRTWGFNNLREIERSLLKQPLWPAFSHSTRVRTD
jgi:hypothetical protein